MKYLFVLFLYCPFFGYSQNIEIDKSNAVLEVEEKDSIFDKGIMKRIINTPKIEDDFTTNGKIVLSVCVDNNGEVIKANLFREHSIDYTEELILIARNNAFKYKFSKSELAEQCGTITYNFKTKDEKEKN